MVKNINALKTYAYITTQPLQTFTPSTEEKMTQKTNAVVY